MFIKTNFLRSRSFEFDWQNENSETLTVNLIIFIGRVRFNQNRKPRNTIDKFTFADNLTDTQKQLFNRLSRPRTKPINVFPSVDGSWARSEIQHGGVIVKCEMNTQSGPFCRFASRPLCNAMSRYTLLRCVSAPT